MYTSTNLDVGWVIKRPLRNFVFTVTNEVNDDCRFELCQYFGSLINVEGANEDLLAKKILVDANFTDTILCCTFT